MRIALIFSNIAREEMANISKKLKEDPKYLDEILPVFQVSHPNLYNMITKNREDFIRRVTGGAAHAAPAPPPIPAVIPPADREVIDKVIYYSI